MKNLISRLGNLWPRAEGMKRDLEEMSDIIKTKAELDKIINRRKVIRVFQRTSPCVSIVSIVYSYYDVTSFRYKLSEDKIREVCAPFNHYYAPYTKT